MTPAVLRGIVVLFTLLSFFTIYALVQPYVWILRDADFPRRAGVKPADWDSQSDPEFHDTAEDVDESSTPDGVASTPAGSKLSKSDASWIMVGPDKPYDGYAESIYFSSKPLRIPDSDVKGPDPQLASQLKVLLPDAASALPSSFLPEYKSPCWRDDDRLTCLPYFYILGAYQNGLKDMLRRLVLHPEVKSGNTVTSNYYFEKRKFSELTQTMKSVSQQLETDPKGIAGDASGGTLTFTWTHSERVHQGFTDTMAECWQGCQKSNNDQPSRKECVRGPTNPDNCFRKSQRADKELLEKAGGEVEVPYLVRATLGQHTPRFVVLLRNPTERYYESYKHYPHYTNHYGGGMQGFEKWVKQQIGAFNTCLETYTLRTCTLLFEALGPDQEDIFYHADQLIKGMYAVFLVDWLTAFPEESFLFIKAEDYYSDTANVLKRVMAHLDVSEPDEELVREMAALARPKSARLAHAADLPEEMSAESRQLLEGFYAPFNKKLAEMAGDDRFLWK